jgi:hypothetical protein
MTMPDAYPITVLKRVKPRANCRQPDTRPPADGCAPDGVLAGVIII